MSHDSLFLPGIPVARVIAAFARAGGQEIESGKLASPESSAALAANCFGWFMERPADLPPFPGLPGLGWPALEVDIECQMRFPWRGGRHPWLDAAIQTPTHLIGIESKRFEPFRDSKTASLSPAYDRAGAWGDSMAPWQAMRDALRANPALFHHLDAAQLVKHALGLLTQARRVGKTPLLVYLYAEPSSRDGKPIPPDTHARHRAEIASLATAVAGAEVGFHATSYRDWLSHWPDPARTHAERLIARFQP